MAVCLKWDCKGFKGLFGLVKFHKLRGGAQFDTMMASLCVAFHR